jgi:F0F1-type ATP synthase assembly protein I
MNRWLTAIRLIGIGWYISLSIVLGVMAGRWLDEKLNTEPLLMIIGLFIGIFVAFYGVYRVLPRLNKNSSKGNS